MAAVIGIDLGTTNSGVAIWEDGGPHMLLDNDGHSLTPSVLALHPESGEWVVGREAEKIGTHNPQVSIYSIKRFMGRRYRDSEIQEDLADAHILYHVEESPRDQRVEVVVDKHNLTPQEVSAKILQKLRHDAQVALGRPVQQAVITVPAYFHESQRQATRDAGRIAGLDVLRVVNEPTAACLAFAHSRLHEARHTVAVYDLGGGTFDISLLEVGRGPFRVLATNGDTHLGGDDIDWAVVHWYLAQQEEAVRRALEDDIHALALLRAAAEQVKIALSDLDETEMAVEGLQVPKNNAVVEPAVLTRERLNEIARPFIKRTLEPCRKALHDAGLRPEHIEEVLLVGGQTRMPAIYDAVAELFGREPDTSVNPDEVVALGAAVQAAILSGEAPGIKLADVVPLSLGVAVQGGKMDTLIPRNTPVPFPKIEIFTTPEDNQEAIEIKIYQGEFEDVNRNIQLGRLNLVLLEKLPAGEPEIEVTFHVDEDGILRVTAEDLGGGNIAEVTITDSVRLSDEEIEQMIQTAAEEGLAGQS